MKPPGFDRGRAVAAIHRTASSAPAQLAQGFAWAVRDSPAHRLEQVMRTPARRVVLESIFWQMPKHLDRERAATVQASVRWCITGRGDGGTDVYQLEIDDGRCCVKRGARSPDPGVTITVNGAEFLRLVSGTSDPMQAYFKGQLSLAGDIMVAARVASLFRIPSAAKPKR